MDAAIGPDEKGRVRREKNEVIRRNNSEAKRIARVVGILTVVVNRLLCDGTVELTSSGGLYIQCYLELKMVQSFLTRTDIWAQSSMGRNV